MTIPEQVGKVGTAAVEGLKTNPSCLAAILLAALFAFLTYIGLQREAERSQKRLEGAVQLLDRCLDDRQSGQRPGGVSGLPDALLFDRMRGL